MSTLTDEDKIALLKLARSVIRAELIKDSPVERPEKISPAMEEKRGCFVTLHKRGALRGCIGTIEPVKSLISGVEDNALNAAFRDPRFPSLKADELALIDVEISVLTVPRVLEWEDGEDLKRKLIPGVHGVILSNGWQGSTFLPQVWDQLPDKQLFLEHLCQKGGMKKDCWTDRETVVKVYEAEYFSEIELFQ
ncbi:AmmeMemoRadiSam system protein A [Desulfobacterales bacterium HSG2]|nr:AmmeMemoRadiSam system protein A [Desulfobacterales bacterium HSG2]